ncbi:MAG: hypothetical protein ACTHNW_22495, partial [Mucilaginibacter sp.]
CSDLEKHKKWGIFLFPEYQTDSLNQNISPIPSPILQRNLFLFKHTRTKNQAVGKAFLPHEPLPFTKGMPTAQKLAPQSVSHSLSATF